jgi:hypothetical protein
LRLSTEPSYKFMISMVSSDFSGDIGNHILGHSVP